MVSFLRIKPDADGPRFHAVDLLVYGFSLIVLIALVGLAGEKRLFRLAPPRWPYLVGAFLLTFIFMQAMASRYTLLLRVLQVKPIPSHLSMLCGTVFAMTSGLVVSRGVGQVLAKPALLKNQSGLPLSQGIYASFIERLMDLATSIVLAGPLLLSITLSSEPNPGFFVVMFLLLACLWVAAATAQLAALMAKMHCLLTKLLVFLGLIPFIRTNRMIESLSHMRAGMAYMEDRHWHDRAGFVILSFLKVLLMSARMYLLALAFSLPISWGYLLLGVPVVQLSLLFAITPGSLGFLDAGWFAVLSLMGVSADSILTLLLAFRATNYLFFPAITLAVWTLWRVFKQGRLQNCEYLG